MADDLKEANIKTEHVLRCIVSHHQREKNMPVSQSADVYSQYRSSSVYGLGKVCVLCKHFLSLMHTNTSACGHVSTKYRHCMHIHVRTNLQPQLTSTRILLQLPSDVLHRPALGSSCKKPTTEKKNKLLALRYQYLGSNCSIRPRRIASPKNSFKAARQSTAADDVRGTPQSWTETTE